METRIRGERRTRVEGPHSGNERFTRSTATTATTTTAMASAVARSTWGIGSTTDTAPIEGCQASGVAQNAQRGDRRRTPSGALGRDHGGSEVKEEGKEKRRTRTNATAGIQTRGTDRTNREGERRPERIGDDLGGDRPPFKRRGDYELIEPIGCGLTSTVWRARRCRTPHGESGAPHGVTPDVALKEIAVDANGMQSVREIDIASRLSHPNVNGFHATFLARSSDSSAVDALRDPPRRHAPAPLSAYCVMDIAPHTLATFVRSPSSREQPTTIRRIMAHMVRGVAHLHRNGVYHCDIKPNNVLIFDGGVAKLADFGASQYASSSPEISQSPMCCAPEGMAKLRGASLHPHLTRALSLASASDQPADRGALDVWALGCCFCCAVSGGSTPFDTSAWRLRRIAGRPAVVPSRGEWKGGEDLEAVATAVDVESRNGGSGVGATIREGADPPADGPGAGTPRVEREGEGAEAMGDPAGTGGGPFDGTKRLPSEVVPRGDRCEAGRESESESGEDSEALAKGRAAHPWGSIADLWESQEDSGRCAAPECDAYPFLGVQLLLACFLISRETYLVHTGAVYPDDVPATEDEGGSDSDAEGDIDGCIVGGSDADRKGCGASASRSCGVDSGGAHAGDDAMRGKGADPGAWTELLLGMLEPLVSERLTASEVCHHPFFQDADSGDAGGEANGGTRDEPETREAIGTTTSALCKGTYRRDCLSSMSRWMRAACISVGASAQTFFTAVDILHSLLDDRTLDLLDPKRGALVLCVTCLILSHKLVESTVYDDLLEVVSNGCGEEIGEDEVAEVECSIVARLSGRLRGPQRWRLGRCLADLSELARMAVSDPEGYASALPLPWPSRGKAWRRCSPHPAVPGRGGCDDGGPSRDGNGIIRGDAPHDGGCHTVSANPDTASTPDVARESSDRWGRGYPLLDAFRGSTDGMPMSCVAFRKRKRLQDSDG